MFEAKTYCPKCTRLAFQSSINPETGICKYCIEEAKINIWAYIYERTYLGLSIICSISLLAVLGIIIYQVIIHAGVYIAKGIANTLLIVLICFLLGFILKRFFR
jgi:hypothetical protein